jgi:hypothetical protein
LATSACVFGKEELGWRYGLAELLIVIAGVLIAMAADGWLEARDLRAAERASLRRLASDMQVDIDDITGNLTRTRLGASAAIWVMEKRGGQIPDADSLSARLTDLSRCSILDANTSEYTALKASGQLATLRDAAFRQRVVNLYEQYAYLSWLYESECRLMEEGFRAIDSQLEFELDRTGESWPVRVTGSSSVILQNAAFQRAVAWSANLRLHLASKQESLLTELEGLRDRGRELAGG